MLIPYGRQDISPQDIEAVREVLTSDWLTQGPAVPRFEQALERSCHAQHAIAVSSGTAALHIACLAIGLGPGDRLWTSPNTFVASANSALFCGATVDFVDIDPRTYNMSVSALESKLRAAAAKGELPRILMPVHFAGQSCRMKEIHQLTRQYGVAVVEDASHAVGAKYLGEPVGSCGFSDICVFSFHPVKIVTTGEGGAALTNRSDLAERMRRLRTHGVTRDRSQLSQDPGQWYYEMLELGYNYRMTDIQAALGASQMGRLEQFVKRRRELARLYDEQFAALPLTTPWQDPDTRSCYHLYPVLIDADRGGGRDRVFAGLRAAEIGVNVHYIPVHLQPYYRQLGFATGDFPASEEYYRRAISLPMYAAMTDAQQQRVVSELGRLLA